MSNYSRLRYLHCCLLFKPCQESVARCGLRPKLHRDSPNTWLIYRKDVKLDAVPTEMFADIAADTKYWLWINGEPVVFEGGLKRGPAPNSIYFDRVDIAPYLKAGDNTIAVLVWHFGKNGFSHVDSGSAGLFSKLFPRGRDCIRQQLAERCIRCLWRYRGSVSQLPPAREQHTFRCPQGAPRLEYARM